VKAQPTDNKAPKYHVEMTVSEIAAIAEGVVERGAPAQRVEALVHDTREGVAGAMFVAIRGENFDGHDYVASAAGEGAVGALVSRDTNSASFPARFFVIRTRDTIEALGRIAAARRMRFPIPVIAVAGSSGKTTTKEMIAHVLSAAGRVHKTSGNLNNLIGLPLTLLGLREEHQMAVVELGMNMPGELKSLTRIAAPTFGVLTNVGLAHLGMFGCEEQLLSAKADFLENLASSAALIYNADCERSGALVRKHIGPRRSVSVGESPGAQVRVVSISHQADGYHFALKAGARVADVALPGFGRYNVLNAAMAAAMALELGMDVETIAARLASFTPHELRSQVIAVNGVAIIADCYNANPDSMFAVIESLAETDTQGRRFAVLGDMLELGAAAPELHASIGRHFGLFPVELLITVGDLARAACDAAAETGQAAIHAATTEEAIALLKGKVAPGDVVLFKASRRMRLEGAVEALKKWIVDRYAIIHP